MLSQAALPFIVTGHFPYSNYPGNQHDFRGNYFEKINSTKGNIMKEIKQPWPRSAKITVWVLGVLLALSAAYIGVLSCKLDDIVNSDEYIRDHILIY